MLTGASKPLASLSSGLLARKGQARPAMRPQGFSSMTGMVAPLEDLGWNDMGSVEQAARPAADGPRDVPAAVPSVLSEREALREEIETAAPEPEIAPVESARPEPVVALVDSAPSEPEAVVVPSTTPEPPVVSRPVSVATATRLARESAQQTKKGKAAFTLRLDGERHLRLRLASALTGRSAQQLVTGALDELIRTLPDVDMLVGQLPPARQSTR